MHAMPQSKRGGTAARLPWSSTRPVARYRWAPLWLLLTALATAAVFSLGTATTAEGNAKGAARVMVENRTSQAMPVELQGNGSRQSRSDVLPPGVCRMYQLECPAQKAAIWLRQPAGSWTAKCLLESGYHYVIEGPAWFGSLGRSPTRRPD